jgi:hypothetical protein
MKDGFGYEQMATRFIDVEGAGDVDLGQFGGLGRV